MTEDALTALGFASDEDGTLVAPGDSDITLTPTGEFFELRIRLGDSGISVVAVLAKRAVKKDQPQ
jgi:hypothetical protein